MTYNGENNIAKKAMIDRQAKQNRYEILASHINRSKTP